MPLPSAWVPGTARRWQRERAAGKDVLKPRPGRLRRIGRERDAALAAQGAADPDVTLPGTATAGHPVAAHSRLDDCVTAPRRPTHPNRKTTLVASKWDEAEGAAFRGGIAGIDPTDLLFLDRSSNPPAMGRRSSPRGRLSRRRFARCS